MGFSLSTWEQPFRNKGGMIDKSFKLINEGRRLGITCVIFHSWLLLHRKKATSKQEYTKYRETSEGRRMYSKEKVLGVMRTIVR